MSEARPEAGQTHDGLSVVLSVDCLEWLTSGLGDESAIERLISSILGSTAAAIGLPADTVTEVSVTLADDTTVREVNAEWRGKDRPTNILSFPMMDMEPGSLPGPLAGDLLLAFETVEYESRSEGKVFAAHFRHLIVHGFLHLLGYDHIEDDEARVMEAVEIAVLADFGIGDPYMEIAAPDTQTLVDTTKDVKIGR